MHKSMFFIVTFAAISLLGGEAAVARLQAISQETAQSFCKRHGGGTDCGFCDKLHCHIITCDSKGKCFNNVSSARTGSGSTKPVSVGGVKTGGDPPPKGKAPVVGGGINAQPTSRDTTTINHSGGGGKK